MQPQRYRCAPIAAMLLVGASLALLPERTPAQAFSAGLKTVPRDASEWIDGRAEENRHHFDKRRFEEARFEMARAFEERHDSRHEMEFDRREHHGAFTSGLKSATRDGGERDRPHHEKRQRDREVNDHALGDQKKAFDPGSRVGNRVANQTTVNAWAPGVAKHGPANDMNRQVWRNRQDAGNAFDPARADPGPGNLVGNRAANNPPVAAAAPAAIKNGQGGQMHHHVKQGAGNQGQQACAKQGQGNQAVNKNAHGSGALAKNGAGNRQGGNNNDGPGNLGGNRFANQNVAANNPNPQAANGNLGGNQNVPANANGNVGQGNQACAKQGPGNNANQKQPNGAAAKNGLANRAGNNKNGTASNFAQARQTPANLAGKNSPANQMHHHAGSNKNGAGHVLNQGSARNGTGHLGNAAVKTAPMQHVAHAAFAKQGHGNASVGRRK
jgi:hypothetical protein